MSRMLHFLKRFSPWKTAFDFVDERHFRAQSDPVKAKALFTDSVTMVEIETFSYCNRRCWFCPNAEYDRTGPNRLMPEELYLGILDQLGSIGYDRKISFSRYNEPLADRIILRRLEQARATCPKALLHMNTNGDYLNRDYLEALYAHGLRSLNIQVYLANDQPYEHERVRRLMLKKIDSLAVQHRMTVDRNNDRLEAKLFFKDMKFRIYGRNFDVNGCNRGETVLVTNRACRTSPCLSPFYHLYIDLDGSVMPCCNLRSDIPQHANKALGSLTEEPDIFSIFSGPRAVSWRRCLVGFEAKRGICSHCAFVPFRASGANRRVQAKLSKMAQAAQSGKI